LESYEKSKKKKREVAKVIVEPKGNGLLDLKHNQWNHYVTSSTPIAWQTKVFNQIASFYDTECWTSSTNSASRSVAARILVVK